MTTSECVPLFSARLVNQEIQLESTVLRVLNSYRYILGAEVNQFEKEFANYVGVEHCVSLGNGTDALVMSLRAVGVRPGDQVALVANAGFYGSTAVRIVGGSPVYVDVEPASRTMSASSLATLHTARIKAVIVTHLYGQMAAMDELAKFCSQNKLALIEDCAQSHGAVYNDQRAGSLGDIAAFSFYPTKNLGGIGDGGAITTNSLTLANTVRTLRQYGWTEKYTVGCEGGFNSRLDEIQAAILRLKLPQLDENNKYRRDIARAYNTAFKDLPMNTPKCEDAGYVAHLYVLEVKQRNKFREYLQKAGIATEIHYPVADHQQPAYSDSFRCTDLSVTERLCSEVVSLPCFPGLSTADVQRVIETVTEYYSTEA
jgi:aminotransferase EvaB